jgi:hypothetical protein
MGVVTPNFLINPEVLRWLNGIEPAWTLLDGSLQSLTQEPSPTTRLIWLEMNLTKPELSGSAPRTHG